MLTARGEVPDRVQGLCGGADDYLVKPFDSDELLVRVGSLLRRVRKERLTPVSQFSARPRHLARRARPGAHNVLPFAFWLLLSPVPRSAPWFLLVICLVGLLLARESRRPGPLSGIDRAFFDWLTANTHTLPAPHSLPPVTLVEIDQTVAETPGRLPLSPLEYALFLQAVGKLDPALVAIEPALDWPRGNSTQTQASGEQILLNQTLAIPKLLFGYRLGSAENGQARDSAAIPVLGGVTGPTGGLAEYPDVVAAPDTRLLPVAFNGATNLALGRGAGFPLRDLPLVFRCRERVLPSFVLQLLTLGLQLAPSEISVSVGSSIRLGNRLRLPLDRGGRALLDPRMLGRVGRVALDDLFLADAGQVPPDNPAAVAAAIARMHGGIVILGRTDNEQRTVHLPGTDRTLSPAEVFAWAAESLEATPPARRASAWWDAALTLAAGTGGVLLLRRSRRGAWVFIVGGVLVYALFALSAFEMSRLWLPCVLPVGLTLAVATLLWVVPPEPLSLLPPEPPGDHRFRVRA